jgi:membrane protein required for beta-lactamase induction
MSPQLYFFVSIAFSFIAWGIVTARYIWPELRFRQRAEALRPILNLHSFRFIGLAFLVPGVVSLDLPAAFAHSAASETSLQRHSRWFRCYYCPAGLAFAISSCIR